jgi:hypothetical protein
MSYSHRVRITDDKSAKEAAKLINERRRQSLKWLSRNNDKRKKPSVVSVVKDK